MDHHKIHPPDIHTGTPRSRIRCHSIDTVLLRSGVDTPSPRTSNIKYYLRPTQRDESPNVPFTSLIDVNISGAHNTHNHSRKRDDDRTTQFSSVSSPTLTTISVVPIQTSAPPFPKWDVTPLMTTLFLGRIETYKAEAFYNGVHDFKRTTLTNR